MNNHFYNKDNFSILKQEKKRLDAIDELAKKKERQFNDKTVYFGADEPAPLSPKSDYHSEQMPQVPEDEEAKEDEYLILPKYDNEKNKSELSSPEQNPIAISSNKRDQVVFNPFKVNQQPQQPQSNTSM